LTRRAPNAKNLPVSMLDAARVAVIVPAYREARLLGRMLGKIPPFVDGVYVVDDASDDGTARVARSTGDPRVRCLVHAQNRGVGAAIASGYRAAIDDGHDVLAVMAGDDQMHPGDLAPLVRTVLAGADYAKGNRFVHPESRKMPVFRRAGGELLSLVTRLSTGLSVSDTQCGYTALSARAARTLPLAELFPRYGYPNDLLGMLASRGLWVVEVPVRPVYADERSGLRPWHAARIPFVIARRWWKERRTKGVPS
jgi:glycosyltransferase involved in cell wall biosynthesis